MTALTPIALDRRAAAAYLASTYGITLSHRTLAGWVSRRPDLAPRHVKVTGRKIAYLRSELDAWALARLGLVVESAA